MLEKMFSIQNLEKAYKILEEKKVSKGIDGVEFLDFADYLKLNWDVVQQQLLNGTYKPHAVSVSEILTKKRKKRTIYQYTMIDQYVQKMIEIELNKFFEILYIDNNYSYRKGKGIFHVLNYALEQVKEGYQYIVEVDIKKFFETIDHKILKEKLHSYFYQKRLEELIMSFQLCDIIQDGGVRTLDRGLITGSSLSPLLSNIYLNEFDALFINDKYARYSDNIFFFCKSEEEGITFLNKAELALKSLNLQVHPDKTKISYYLNAVMLGHRFVLEEGIPVVQKETNKIQKYYSNWHSSSIKQIDHMFHILSEGILIRKDYSLLFENDEIRMNIPIEATRNFNIFSNVTFSSEFFKRMNQKEIRVAIFDERSNFIGAFIPASSTSAADTLLKQVTIYNDEVKRQQVAITILFGAFKNIINFLKYHQRRNPNKELINKIDKIETIVKKFKQTTSIQQLMALEASARETYYSCFNDIIKYDEFKYQKRTKRPPKDALNAMISFGNTLIYQLIASEIYRTSLDIRISCLHSSKRRYENLNLDLAEIFKPMIVDRMIFSLINRKQIDVKLHFERKNNGVYLNKLGKKIFIKSFMKKMNQQVAYGEEELSYYTIVQKEIRKYRNMIVNDKEYSPYRVKH